jgi:hypothetical protein
MSSDGHGIPDSAAKGAHDLMHHAEQEQHEHEAAAKRGLTDEAVEKEHEFLEGIERRASVCVHFMNPSL